MIRAPWTDEQVRNINEFQRCGLYHPYVCGCPYPQRNSNLQAYRHGLYCEQCGYFQEWVIDFMADGSAVAVAKRAAEKGLL